MHHTALLVAVSALRSYASSPSCCDKVRGSELVLCCPRASSVSPLCRLNRRAKSSSSPLARHLSSRSRPQWSDGPPPHDAAEGVGPPVPMWLPGEGVQAPLCKAGVAPTQLHDATQEDAAANVLRELDAKWCSRFSTEQVCAGTAGCAQVCAT